MPMLSGSSSSFCSSWVRGFELGPGAWLHQAQGNVVVDGLAIALHREVIPVSFADKPRIAVFGYSRGAGSPTSFTEHLPVPVPADRGADSTTTFGATFNLHFEAFSRSSCFVPYAD